MSVTYEQFFDVDGMDRARELFHSSHLVGDEAMTYPVKLDEFMDEDSDSWDLAGNECGSSFDELDCHEHGNCVLRQCRECGTKLSCDQEWESVRND
jgi:hypothetical protein